MEMVSPAKWRIKKHRHTYLQCDFCGVQNVKVKHNNGSAMNFCKPDNRNKFGHCFSNYSKWITSFNLSRGLPHIVQTKYAQQLQPKNHVTDTVCHYCGVKEGASTKLVKVPTGTYDDTSNPMLYTLGYQMFCKNKDCLRKFVESMERLRQGRKHTSPYIMKHMEFILQ